MNTQNKKLSREEWKQFFEENTVDRSEVTRIPHEGVVYCQIGGELSASDQIDKIPLETTDAKIYVLAATWERKSEGRGDECHFNVVEIPIKLK